MQSPAELSFHEATGGQAPPEAQYDGLTHWIETVITERGGTLGVLTYIFCGDDYLHEMNVSYLDHDTLTDIITFPYGSFPEVSGDLFISTERVEENARELEVDYEEELHRVMIHGVLHLCGQGDKTEAEARAMRELEDWALGLRKSP